MMHSYEKHQQEVESITDDKALNVCAMLRNFEIVAQLVRENKLIEATREIRTDNGIGLIGAHYIMKCVQHYLCSTEGESK